MANNPNEDSGINQWNDSGEARNSDGTNSFEVESMADVEDTEHVQDLVKNGLFTEGVMRPTSTNITYLDTMPASHALAEDGSFPSNAPDEGSKRVSSNENVAPQLIQDGPLEPDPAQIPPDRVNLHKVLADWLLNFLHFGYPNEATKEELVSRINQRNAESEISLETPLNIRLLDDALNKIRSRDKLEVVLFAIIVGYEEIVEGVGASQYLEPPDDRVRQNRLPIEYRPTWEIGATCLPTDQQLIDITNKAHEVLNLYQGAVLHIYRQKLEEKHVRRYLTHNIFKDLRRNPRTQQLYKRNRSSPDIPPDEELAKFQRRIRSPLGQPEDIYGPTREILEEIKKSTTWREINYPKYDAR